MSEELEIPADYSRLDEARMLIHWTARQTGFDEAAIHDMKVAATEALANAIEHGTSGDGLVRMLVTPADGELQLEISGGAKAGGDSATRPQVPEIAGAAPRRGRGMAIMSALTDEFAFRREGDRTLVRLVKRRTPVAADLPV